MDLAKFLEARIAEDRLLALTSCAGSNDREWTAEPEGMFEGRILDSRGETVVYDEGSPTHAQAMHIARHDPARVLREAGAKRKILAYHAPEFTDYRDGDGIERGTYECTECDPGGSPDNWPCRTMRALAAVYADHKDYQQEWGQ